MAQPKVFVSHSHLDDAFAEQLVKDLRAAGADAWLDNTDLGAGDFQERISEALDKCEWFVLVLTKHALASHWVRQEVHAANSLKHQGRIRNLIFMKAGPVEHSEVPALWNVYNVFDATTEYVNARSRMLKALGLSPTPQPAAPERAPQPQPARAPTASPTQPVEVAPMQVKAKVKAAWTQAPPPVAAPRTPSVAGVWIEEAGDPFPWMFDVTQNGQTLTGAAEAGQRPGSYSPSIAGHVSGELITIEYDVPDGPHWVWHLRLVQGRLVGTVWHSGLSSKTEVPVTRVRR